MSLLRPALVIPGRNASKTLGACLKAVAHYRQSGAVSEVIFVDDGSTDDSAAVAEKHNARVIRIDPAGPGGARNAGWRATQAPVIWFIDSDCVARPGALEFLLPHLESERVGGVGGSYANELPDSWLARVIHAEIRARHRRMPPRVGYLATYNVLYRREVLEALGGFDESRFNAPGKPGAEDIDFAYRASAAGWELRFEPRSEVGHYHPTRLKSYLRTQRQHGVWRVALHFRHPRQGLGDHYSSGLDHAQPFLALAAAASTPLLIAGRAAVPTLLWGSVLAAHVPMALRLLDEDRWVTAARFPFVGSARALWRGVGLVAGVARQTTLPRESGADA